MTASKVDTLALAQALIRCPSVTPVEGGALDLLQSVLSDLGFTCHRLPFAEEGAPETDNLYARLGENGPNLCYAGHTDVVPAGDTAAWSSDPFAAEARGGVLYGRGAVDMKGSIAAFVSAVSDYLREGRPQGSISLLITGDEEGDAVNGTRKVLRWLAERGETLDVCLVGEPTSNEALADNPLHHLARMLNAVVSEALDEGNAHFPPSSLQITSVDVGNPVTNVIPAKATALFNVRFNNIHSSASVEAWLRERFDKAIDRSRGGAYELSMRVSGESFLCPPGAWSDLVSEAVASVTGKAPELGTTGGTSDARFIKNHCTVAELGLKNATAHKVDEQVPLEDLERLTAIYRAVLERYHPR